MPGHDGRSLEQASQDTHQELHALSEWVVQELDTEKRLDVEVNGIHVASLPCLDHALTELAAGWAFLHRFCESPAEFDRASLGPNHASVMVEGGRDIERHLAYVRGELRSRLPIPDPYPRDEQWEIYDDVLLDILREAFQNFRADRATEGYIHAALASDRSVDVIAADLTPELAVCKVLGWSLMNDRYPQQRILIVNGTITRATVDAAARLGVQLIATPFAPTADAWRAARVLGVSLVGYARSRTVAVFHNAEMIVREEPAG